MDKSEYWLLDSVIRYTSPIDVLAGSKDDIIMWFNRAEPGLTLPELVDVFHRLFQARDLVATRTDRKRDLWFECFFPTKQEIEAGLSQEIYFDYGLTPKGGARWEAETQADWSRFLEIQCGQSITIKGSNRSFIESVLEDLGKSQDFSILEPVWEVLRPWPALYWKTLPVGHQVTYKYDYDKSKTPLVGRIPHPLLPIWYVKPQ